MAKLYAELSSDKGGRVASRGGNDYMHVSLKHGNIEVATIEMNKYGELVIIKKLNVSHKLHTLVSPLYKEITQLT